MKMNNKPVLVVLTVCALASLQASAADNLIINGGFETTPAGYTSGSYYNTTVVPGWSVVGDVDYVNDSYFWKPHSGSQSLDLNGYNQGGVEQTITVKETGIYKLSFWYAGNFYGDPAQKSMHYVLDGKSGDVNPIVGPDGIHNVNWTEKDIYVHLTADQPEILSFTSRTPGNAGPALDDVSLTLVPEPYQYGLASVFGLFGLAAFDRIRQRRLCR